MSSIGSSLTSMAESTGAAIVNAARAVLRAPARVVAHHAELKKQKKLGAGMALSPAPRVDNRPTRERQAKLENEVVAYLSNANAGRDVATEAVRVAPDVEEMNKGLGDKEKLAMEEVERCVAIVYRSVGVSSYGLQSRGGGTPLSQTKSDVLLTAEKVSDAEAKLVRIGRRISHTPTLEVLFRMVMGLPYPGSNKDPSATEAGRNFMRYGNRHQNIAAGQTMLKIGLQQAAVALGYMEDRGLKALGSAPVEKLLLSNREPPR